MRKWHRHGLFFALLVLPALAAPPAVGRPVRVDRSFGRNGIARTRLGPSFQPTSFTSLSEEPDGAVLALRDDTAWRYLANGRLDPGFKPHPVPPPPTGKVKLTQPDGKTVVAEAVTVGPASKPGSFQEVVVSRFNPDGSPDRGFGSGGAAKLRAEYGIQESRPQGLLAQGDGGVLVIGSSYAIKLDSAGKLETSFGAGGTAKSAGSIVAFHRLAGDGLMLAGSVGGWPRQDFYLERYRADGRPDPAFGGGGGVATADSGGADAANAALWEADGSIAIGGVTAVVPASCTFRGNCDSAPVVARFTADGSLDASFGTAGIATLGALPGKVGSSVPGEVGVLALAERPGGGVLAAGTSNYSVAFIAALDPAGRLDPGFGEGGIVRERRPKPSSQEIGAIAVARNGRILVAGRTNAGTELGAVLFRYRPNGVLDHSFAGGAGFARLLLGQQVVALTVDRRRRSVLLSGPATLTRVGAGGAVDGSFGREGHVRPPGHLELKSIAALRHGRVLAAGQIALKGVARMVVFRLRPNGAPDPSFGNRGRLVLGSRRRCPCDLRRLAVQPDGRIVLAGSARGAVTVTRLLPDGRLDRGFGRGGRFAMRLGKPSEATAVAVRDGRILVAGWSGKGRRAENVLLRLTPRGRRDRSFARGGTARVRAPKSTEPTAVLLTRHRIFVVRKGAGQTILAFRPNGRLDRSFAGNRNVAPRRFGGAVGALQRGDPLLAWTTRERKGSPRTIALQRLDARR